MTTKTITYRCSECGAVAQQGVDEQGSEGLLYCAKHPRAVIDSVVGAVVWHGQAANEATARQLASEPRRLQ